MPVKGTDEGVVAVNSGQQQKNDTRKLKHDVTGTSQNHRIAWNDTHEDPSHITLLQNIIYTKTVTHVSNSFT